MFIQCSDIVLTGCALGDENYVKINTVSLDFLGVSSYYQICGWKRSWRYAAGEDLENLVISSHEYHLCILQQTWRSSWRYTSLHILLKIILKIHIPPYPMIEDKIFYSRWWRGFRVYIDTRYRASLFFNFSEIIVSTSWELWEFKYYVRFHLREKCCEDSLGLSVGRRSLGSPWLAWFASWLGNGLGLAWR